MVAVITSKIVTCIFNVSRANFKDSIEGQCPDRTALFFCLGSGMTACSFRCDKRGPGVPLQHFRGVQGSNITFNGAAGSMKSDFLKRRSRII